MLKSQLERLAQLDVSEKKKIAVLFGGCSSEYEISLQSAYAIMEQIDSSRYELIPIGITKAGEWYFYGGELKNIINDQWFLQDDCIPILFSPSKKLHGFLALWQGKQIEVSLDAAFPVLHGKNGEDGTVQGVLELVGIPIIGCGTLCSALCMDKDMAHRVAAAAGVRVPHSFVLTRKMDAEITLEQSEKIGYPLFIKPVRAGSSFGITKVTERNALPQAIKAAFEHDERVLIEETISGFEVGCAVLGKDKLTIGAVDEIELADGFFDYTEKYTLKTAKIHVPARISAAQAAAIKNTAALIFRAMNCSGFARVDLFLTSGGDIVFNEVNTIPGFTSHSRYPSMMKKCGIPFSELVERLIETEMRK